MKAKEMFEELGMIPLKIDDEDKKYYIGYIDKYAPFGNTKRIIKFWLLDKIIYNLLDDEGETLKGSCPINIDLLQAINQQIKELGWDKE